MGEPVRLELTGDEALVLFDFRQRFDDEVTVVIRDQAEERALWSLQRSIAPGRLGQRSSDDPGTGSCTHRCAMG